MADDIEIGSLKAVRVLSCEEPDCPMSAVCFPSRSEPGELEMPDGWGLQILDGKLKAWCPAHGERRQ
jgi:hypothetical protein